LRDKHLPLIILDREFWRPGWVEKPRNEWRAKVIELVARDAWIMEGNYGSSLDLRLPRADTVIWFDYPSLHVARHKTRSHDLRTGSARWMSRADRPCILALDLEPQPPGAAQSCCEYSPPVAAM
jgi:hypothetical protein